MSEEEEDINFNFKLHFLGLTHNQESCLYFTTEIKIGSPDAKIVLNCDVLSIEINTKKR